MKRSLSISTLILVCLALLALLALTALAAFFDLGPWNTVIALGIAVAKLLLIVLFFMHLKISNKVTWLFAVAGFVWLGILFTLSLGDFATRGVLHIPGK